MQLPEVARIGTVSRPGRTAVGGSLVVPTSTARFGAAGRHTESGPQSRAVLNQATLLRRRLPMALGWERYHTLTAVIVAASTIVHLLTMGFVAIGTQQLLVSVRMGVLAEQVGLIRHMLLRDMALQARLVVVVGHHSSPRHAEASTTHLHNIYEKTDVHSRQALVDLLLEQDS